MPAYPARPRRRTVIALVALAVALKMALAALVPLTGDEAYFLIYARAVDWGGFYDHPGMVGWMLWLMERFGSHPLVLRLPAVATGLVLPALLYRTLRPLDAERAALAALLLLFTPIYLVFVFITTDVGVVLFGFASMLAVQRGVGDGGPRWFALGGVLLGLAFLSKYFAALLGLAYAVHLLAVDRRHWRGFLVLLAAALPFGLLNLAWNYLHCWDNVMFNVFNRNAGEGPSLAGPAVYAATLVYLFAFPLWWLARQRGAVADAVRRHRLGLFVTVAAVPLGLFALVSVIARIGLHWLVLFAPAVYAAYLGLAPGALRRALVLMAGFGILHAAALLALALVPPTAFRGTELHRDAALYLAPAAFADALPRPGVDFRATPSYSRSAVLSYYTGRYWSVFGTGSEHARQDDRLTDWRRRDGGTMLYTAGRGEVPRAELERYFERVEVGRIEAGGATFAFAVARGFDYGRYRDEVIARIRERYYDIPAFLPVGGCGFLERYFPDRRDVSSPGPAAAGPVLARREEPCERW